MNSRNIITYGGYFEHFFDTLTKEEQEKVGYALLLLKTQERLPTKWIKHIKDGLYELRIEYNSNTYRIFFTFDKGNIVVLFNCFQKKSQKTPKKEIELALTLKRTYYEEQTSGK